MQPVPAPLPASSVETTNTPQMVGEQISLSEATAWTATYQSNHKEQLKAVYFSADVFTKLLQQGGAEGIRIYLATNDEGKDCFVLVGATVDSDLTAGESKLFDKGNCCPDTCVSSPLNHT